MSQTKSIDKPFLFIVASLLVLGLISFVSASFGILAKNEAKFYSVLFNQIVFGLGGGILALWLTLKVPYKFWRTYSFYLFLLSVLVTLLVFVPGIGLSHGGARRWISILGVSFQPVELLKIGFIIYFAGWLSWVKHRAAEFKMGVLPLLVMLLIVAGVLLRQPDTKNLILLLVAGSSMLFVSGVSWKYIGGIFLVGAIAFGSLIYFKPYIRARVMTFLDQNHDPRGASHQVRQSLVAVGSGGVFGRGLGQSIQKFTYLPEPQGDSIFAVIGEEFGFVGSTLLVLLFAAFCTRGLTIAARAPDAFSRLYVVGIVILLTAQSFLNIASAIGLFPLTGVPLVFVSHGGTALMFSLAAIGIVLNISRYQREA